MGFTGYNIFPGYREIGVLDPSVRELGVVFNASAIGALQGPVDDDMKWAEIAGVTPGTFDAKIPIDLTVLDGFEEWSGKRDYKQVDLIALSVSSARWNRNLEWPLRYNNLGNIELGKIYNQANWATALVNAGRVMKPRLAATVLMQGTPSTAKALVYVGNNIPGAGLPLFSHAAGAGDHYANPMDANSRRFANYFPAAGTFGNTTYATTRKNMRMVPAPTMSAETLGLQVTDIIGPSIMEEPFRAVAIASLIMQTATVGGSAVGAGVSNIYTQATTPCNFWVAPQLDGDPYVIANPNKHMWIAVSRRRPGANLVEMVGPTAEFMPQVTLMGEGTEMATESGMIRLLGDLWGSAAAGLPHVGARYEET